MRALESSWIRNTESLFRFLHCRFQQCLCGLFRMFRIRRSETASNEKRLLKLNPGVTLSRHGVHTNIQRFWPKWAEHSSEFRGVNP